MRLHYVGGKSCLDPKQPIQPKLGAAPLKFVRNNINYKVVSFDDLYFNYQPPVDVEHPDGNITKGAKTPMAIPKADTGIERQEGGHQGLCHPFGEQ